MEKLEGHSIFQRIEKRESGCWEWVGPLFQGKKYGAYYWGFKDGGPGKTMQSHRAAWIIENGPIPTGMILCHKCDNPPCCNPDHLYVGTHQTNADDRERSGNTSKWNHRYNFKRDDSLLSRLKAAFLAGLTVKQVCEVLDIGWQTVYRCRDQDPELKEIIKETKTSRYSKAASARGIRPLNRYEIQQAILEKEDEAKDG